MIAMSDFFGTREWKRRRVRVLFLHRMIKNLDMDKISPHFDLELQDGTGPGGSINCEACELYPEILEARVGEELERIHDGLG